MKLSATTNIGVSRPDNQDNFWCSRLDVDGEEVAVVCLCDGMGGMNKGGLASQLVTEGVRDYFKTSTDFEGLLKVVHEVNRRIYEMGMLEGSRLGTTCTILVCQKGNYHILHVGDTRCYLIRDGVPQQVTTDHSALVKYGITYQNNPELYRKYKSKLTNCIGVASSVNLDEYEGVYMNGDAFLVCSDGFWHYLDYGNVLDLKVDLDTLIERCIAGGEQDNITVSVLRV